MQLLVSSVVKMQTALLCMYTSLLVLNGMTLCKVNEQWKNAS